MCSKIREEVPRDGDYMLFFFMIRQVNGDHQQAHNGNDRSFVFTMRQKNEKRMLDFMIVYLRSRVGRRRCQIDRVRSLIDTVLECRAQH